MHVRSRMVGLVAAGLALSLVAVGCGDGETDTSTGGDSGGSGSSEPIRFGGLLDETGAAAPNGTAALEGVELAFEQVNDAGGINGRKLELDQQDPAFDIGQATALMQRFVGDASIVGLIGPNSDTVSTPLTDPVNKAKIVSVITSGAGGRTNKEYGEWMFSLPVRNNVIVDAVVKELANLDLKKVAVVYSTSRPFAVAAGEYFVEQAEKNDIEIVGDPYGFADTDVNFSSILTQIKSSGDVDAVFCSCLANAAGPMINQGAAAGLDVRWVSDASLLDPNFYKLSQGTADGTIVATPFDTNRDDTTVQDFLKAFQDKYGKEPSVYNAYGYDSALAVIRALEAIDGDITRESLREAMSKLTFDGATGKVSFPDGMGVADREDVFVVQMQGGKFVPMDA